MAYFQVKSKSSSSITVEVIGYSQGTYTYDYTIYDHESGDAYVQGYITGALELTFNSLSPGHQYAIQVLYGVNTPSTTLDFYNGSTYTYNYGIVTTDSGGGGGGGSGWSAERVANKSIEDGDTIRQDADYPQAYTLDYWRLTFDTSGPWIITANNSNTYYAYLTTSISYDDQYGQPDTGVIGSYTSSGSISFNVNVTAGTYYYFWIRTRTGSQGNETFNITFTYSSAPTPSTDGKVYIFDGTSWHSATPYIFDGTSWHSAKAYIYNGTYWKVTKEV